MVSYAFSWSKKITSTCSSFENPYKKLKTHRVTCCVSDVSSELWASVLIVDVSRHQTIVIHHSLHCLTVTHSS